MSAAVLITVNGVTSVIASQAQGPQGPAGPSAAPGAAGQIYVTNAAATAPAWATVSGDATASAVTVGKLTVTGWEGVALDATTFGTPSDAWISVYRSGSTKWFAVAFSGDMTVGNTGTTTVAKIHGASVPAAGALSTGNVLQVTGASALGYGPVPAASVAPGTVGQTYITGTGPTAGWDSTLLITSGSLVTLASAATIKQTQGGTLPAPTAQYPIVLQPRDPAKAPFHLGYLAAATFNSTVDVTMAVGYNTDLNNTDSAIYWRLEQDYEVTPGTHWFEYYIEYVSSGAHSSFIRPIYINVDKVTNVGQMIFELPSPTTGGSIAFTSGDLTQTYCTVTNTSWLYRNNYQVMANDSTVTPRNVFWLTSANYLQVGDVNNTGGLVLQGGTNGIINETGSGNQWLLWDTGNVQRVKMDATHGAIEAGQGGSDYYAAIGPLTGSETTQSALWLLANGTARSGTNYAITTNTSNVLFNVVSGSGSFYFFQGGSAELAQLSASALTMVTPAIQADASVSTFTVGTDKSAATLVLQAGAAATALTLSNPSGTLVASTTAGQVVGFWQNHGTNYTIDSAGAGDDQVWMTAACTITLPNPAANAGRKLEIIVNYDPASGGGSIKRHGSENINGAASDITLVTGDKYSVIQVRCDGGNWIIKGGLSI